MGEAGKFGLPEEAIFLASDGLSVDDVGTEGLSGDPFAPEVLVLDTPRASVVQTSLFEPVQSVGSYSWVLFVALSDSFDVSSLAWESCDSAAVSAVLVSSCCSFVVDDSAAAST